MVVADADAAAVLGRRIRAGAPARLDGHAAALAAGRPGRPGGPATVDRAVGHPDAAARARAAAVLGRRVVALARLALAAVRALRHFEYCLAVMIGGQVVC